MIQLGKNLLLGITEIDDQHQQLADLINAIHHEVNQHAWKESSGSLAPDQRRCCHRVRLLLEQLATLTETHFASEEQLMAQSRYPDLSAHRLEHRLMLAEFKGFFRAICEGEACLKPADLVALKGWFIGHLANDDRAFAHFLVQLEPSPTPQPVVC